MTYQSFVAGNSWPYTGTSLMENGDQTRLRVDLISTGRTLQALLEGKQPRVWGDYGGSLSPPILIRSLVTLNDPYPTLKSESILVPLSQNGLIDRIRIERIRGTYQLYQIDLYRLGNRSPSQ
jgi:hypothetical protein